MTIDLSGKSILISGAGRGIGRALALGLAAEGARIGVLELERKHAEEVVAEIAEIAGAPAALAVEADVGAEAAVAAAAATLDKEWGQVHGLINNAAWIPPRQPILDHDTAAWERVLRVNVVGSFLTTKHIAPLMIRTGGGRIIYLSSAIGVQANPGQAAYGGSKAAVNILSNVAHQELAGSGIRTVAVAPGLTDSPGMHDSLGEDYIARVSAAYPSGRLGQPSDLVGLAAFLCSDLANHLSGTVITVRPPANR
ncbi:SDR family NAD(P)-dependent oxidoreductase [Amycolatopsis pithecellobii]|uniref:SDR family oxidoreductase n=1 Tax=Amycolatopsis pithecellobii TaxID=664692 RepID=A0A6N7Z0J5_9PSEU|nr:SDR family NAD(P)-dependent oxidoreductase [Amycolatopsis pithecellobii]MTD53281.1 SDR family oxidoreductase [Amycolatopsis pithecellobii]